MRPRLLRLGLLVGLGCVGAVRDAAEIPGAILAESDFSWDLDGWGVEGDGARDLAHMTKLIKAGDSGAEMWYFVAPSKFVGAKRDAYGGKLCFRHGFYEFNRSALGAAARCNPPPPTHTPHALRRVQAQVSVLMMSRRGALSEMQRRQGHHARL
jgi:hypothetical protein